MKLDKIKFFHMMKKMLDSYNAFVTEDSVRGKSEAYFEKLQWQETRIVEKVMQQWDGAKMPNAAEILMKCKGFGLALDMNIPLSPHESMCRYMDYGHTNECETSRYLCSNQSENWKIDAERVRYCLSTRPDKKIICYWHSQVIKCEIAKIRVKNGGHDMNLQESWADMMIEEFLSGKTPQKSLIVTNDCQSMPENGQNTSIGSILGGLRENLGKSIASNDDAVESNVNGL